MIPNPLYHIEGDHTAGLVGLAVLIAMTLLVAGLARSGYGPARRMRYRYTALPPVDRFLVWCLAISAAVHLGLFGHRGPFGLAFVVDGILLGGVALRILTGRPSRRVARVVLLGSLAAWWVTVLAGEPPDQLGIATKLIELAAIAIVLRPRPGRRVRGALTGIVTTILVLVTGIAGWAGAFVAAQPQAQPVANVSGSPGSGSSVVDSGHGHGAVPGPTVVMDIRAAGTGEASSAEQAAADRFYAATKAAVARFADPAMARAAGYRLDGLAGVDFHAVNSAYEGDGLVLDPARPEMLVYAASRRGPILLGAAFVMPGLHESGPAVGGPLTTWHAHEDVCLSILPPGLSGALSPLGDCPVGSLTLPMTAEMLHVWVAPGAPTRFGDLPEAWRQAYVARLGA